MASKRSILKILLPVIVLMLSGAVFHVLLASKPDPSKPVLREKIWQVAVVEAMPGARSPVIRLYGRIESPEQLRAAAPGNGVVNEVHVREGARVASGAPLVTLDQRDFEVALAQSNADLRDIKNQIEELKIRHRANLSALETENNLLQLAEAEVERLVKLQQRQLSADTALNSARSERGRQQLAVNSRQLEVDRFPAQLEILIARGDRAQAMLNDANLAMSRSELRAPFEAIVSEVTVSAGDRVSLGQILVSLFPVNGLEIRAHLPLKHIAPVQQAIAEQASLTASVADLPAMGQFRLDRLAGEAEATGIDAFFLIDRENLQLRPGELLPLDLELPPIEDIFSVPYQAVYGNSRIYRVVDDRLEAIDVESLGQSRNQASEPEVLIRSARITAGDLIAATHLPNAVTGLKVEIDEQ